MERRAFLKSTALMAMAAIPLVGCGTSKRLSILADDETTYVTMYDTHAVSLYFDGTMGPKTGIIKVEYILANEPVTIQFWHGHGGVQHTYVVTPDHFAALKRGERVMVETDIVADHSHKLFIDPTDAQWRVQGAEPVEVPVEPPAEDPPTEDPDPIPDPGGDQDTPSQ